MPLTVSEQLSISGGTTAPPQFTLVELIKQSAVVEAIAFNNTKDVSGDANAALYLEKMNRVITQLFNSSVGTIEKLKHILIAIYAPTGDFATVQAASQTAWENFVANNVWESLEELAQATSVEKAAYDALP